MANTPQDIFTAIEQQLSAINGSAGYATQIGTKIYLGQVQRTGMKEHSIAIGARSGLIDRTGETRLGRAMSAKARQIDLIIEAAMPSRPDQFLQDGLLMLEDIERAWRPAPAWPAPPSAASASTPGRSSIGRKA